MKVPDVVGRVADRCVVASTRLARRLPLDRREVLRGSSHALARAVQVWEERTVEENVLNLAGRQERLDEAPGREPIDLHVARLAILGEVSALVRALERRQPDVDVTAGLVRAVR